MYNRKKLKFIFLSLPLILLTACSNNSPNESLIEKDISDAILEYANDNEIEISLDSINLVNSLSEDKNFSATYNIVVNNVSGAEDYLLAFYIPTKVEYIKYDQGWEIECCHFEDWKNVEYSVEKYPEIETLNRYNDISYSFDPENEYHVVDFEKNNRLDQGIDFTTKIYINIDGKYLNQKEIITQEWVFDKSDMFWNVETDHEWESTLKDNLASEIIHEDDGDCIFENLTKDSVLVSGSCRNDVFDKTRFDFDEYTTNYAGGQYLYYSCNNSGFWSYSICVSPDKIQLFGIH